jgi:Aspartyl protease
MHFLPENFSFIARRMPQLPLVANAAAGAALASECIYPALAALGKVIDACQDSRVADRVRSRARTPGSNGDAPCIAARNGRNPGCNGRTASWSAAHSGPQPLKLGQFCDAVLPIESWVALNPARNDTSQTRAIIADYTAKGHCQAGAASGAEVFKIARQNGVAKLPVSINGLQGNLILDTGATFLLLDRNVRAKGQAPDRSRQLPADAHRQPDWGRQAGRAATIQLRTLAAKDVPIVVQSDAKAGYGDGVDGLLGTSFLWHFNVSIGTQAIRISSRKVK